jgi:hypothetical protein
MFVGFIAVVVILLVIVGLMATGSLGNSQNSSYITEAKKVHTLFSNLHAESKFYYIEGGESFSGINMDYFVRTDFAKSNMIINNPGMNEADWEGWPTVDVGSDQDANGDGVLDSPYTGPYLKLGGTAGEDFRIIVTSINDGTHAGFFLLKKVGTTVPPEYIKILEKTLAADPSYIGG